MGSSASYYLSKNNQKVLGIDQFKPPHNFGSSHGESRIIREAYFEHPLYVPLVKRAYQLWNELEQQSNEKLFLETGGLMLGQKEFSTVKGSELSAKTFNLDYQYLDSEQIKNKYPGFNPDENTVGILESKAGILFPEKCIETFLKLAEKQNAQFKYNEKVLNWNVDGNLIKVITDKNEYYTQKVIFTAGAWTKELVPQLNSKLSVRRQVLLWYETNNNSKFKPENFPVYIWEYKKDRMFYGFPDIGNGLKIAIHHEGYEIKPENLKKDVTELEKEEMTDIVRKYLSGIDGKIIKTETCMYTNTSDQNFIIDFHPENSKVILASPCSGHGFKFSSAIGEILSQMIIDKKTKFDLEPFKLNSQRASF